MGKILIVSEDGFMGELLRLALADLDAEVRCVPNVGRMTELCRRTNFDVVVLLGAGSFWGGSDPARLLRPRGMRRPVIYVLAWQQSEHTVMSLLEAGADQYMTFPVNLYRLRRKIIEELRSL
ncbi:MAG: response regulator transcription factor [Rikenellaceae bacterium]|nr:response regulator transcription factor [Rikenellaceae bacterium]